MALISVDRKMLHQLSSEDFCRILKQYKYNLRECLELLSELRIRGLEYFYNYGLRNIYGSFRVVGAGFTGVSLLALFNNKVSIVKILRKDSRRTDMLHECKILELSSRLGVSPHVYSCSKNYIVMEFVDGPTLAEYLKEYQALERLYDLRLVLRSIIYKAYLLDAHHIDHGELSRPYKHVILSPRGVYFVDFDSASLLRKPRNLTSILGGIFFRYNEFSRTITSSLGINVSDLEQVRSLVKDYKKHMEFNIVEKIMIKLKIF